MNKAYNKITWQNKPSTATPLNQTNLNEMSNALDTIDDRVIALDAEVVKDVAITNTLQTGDTIATITVDGTATNIKSAQVEVDAEPSATSENPLQNKAIYAMLNEILPEGSESGNPISIADASGLNAKACSVDLFPIQDLSQGDPSPTNVCPISGRNSVTLTVNSDDIETTFENTVYGGKVDFVNGKLTIDKGYVVYDGSDDESWSISNSRFRIARPADYKSDCTSISNLFPQSFSSGNPNNTFYVGGSNVVVRYDTVTTTADFKTFLSSNPMQLCYELETPIEITLTAEQISLLKGNNTLTTDGDNIILKYSADIKAWVENQLQS